MEKGNFYNHQQMQSKDAPILQLQDDQNALPITEKSLSHNQNGELVQGVAPPFAPPLRSMPPVGGDAADGLNRPVNQGPMWSTLEPNPQTQVPIGHQKGPGTNKAAQNPNSKAPIIAPFREHDLCMPIANVVRIMRRGLPPHAKVADEAKEMVQECVSEFISFITSEANEGCQLEHRKTITAEDVIGAMSRLGFDHYVEPLSMYLQKYRESDMLPPMPRCGVGRNSNEVTAITSTTNVLPPLAVVHPQFAAVYETLFGNDGTYPSFHDGSGTSSGSMNMGHILDPPDTASVCNGSDQNLAPGTDDGPPNCSEEASPSGPPQPGLDFYFPYDQYK